MDKGYITLIHAYAADHLNEGFLFSDMLKYLRDNGINLDDKEIHTSIERTVNNDVIYGVTHRTDRTRQFMLPEAYYRHLDYLELKAAQENAKDARRWAIWAIVISAFLALIQVLVGVIQLLKP